LSIKRQIIFANLPGMEFHAQRGMPESH
jgi:hypothetical protein